MMDIRFLNPNGNWIQKLLCVTHADRPTQPERASLNFLENRYSKPDRLPAQIPFDALTPIAEHQPYDGSVTVWEFADGDFSKPRLLAFLYPGYKPQHAIWYQEKLWILGVDRLEVYSVNKSELSRLTFIEDPWLSGTHTVFPDGRGHMLVTCSASDSVLLVDTQTYQVVSALRLPKEICGHDFDLAGTDSVVDHYIHNDLQLTHINCATPWRGGIVLSTLIQGAIGWFDPNGTYHELLRGFVGCHGVRADARTDRLYFSDSCLGVIIFLDERFAIERQVATGSIWLHDAQQLGDDVFATAAMDRNQVEVMNVNTQRVVAQIPGTEFGLGPTLLYYGD